MSFLCLLGVSALSVCSLCVSAQQRMCEQLTRVVDIVAGLLPFQATFEKAPVSERMVIVMALGPYDVQSDTSGHVCAQFLKFAAANSADLLRLSLRCPLPGLMLQAAQLANTQIEEFILNCHQAGQKWDCVRLVDEFFDVGASHMSVFDETPENSVFIAQPHLRKDQTRPTNALPSMLVFPTKHINILENWRRAFLANMMPFTVQSSSNEATDSFASVLSNTCADPWNPPLGVFSSNETFERRFFLRMEKSFELFERLCCGRFAANIAIKCSTQVFFRVWFFGFSLQPPKCPENVFLKCGGLFFEEKTRRLQMHIQATTEPQNHQCPCPM